MAPITYANELCILTSTFIKFGSSLGLFQDIIHRAIVARIFEHLFYNDFDLTLSDLNGLCWHDYLEYYADIITLETEPDNWDIR